MDLLISKRRKRGAISLSKGMEGVTAFFVAILVLGVIGFALIIVLGNLQGSDGFTAGSYNANQSDAVLQNLTAGSATFFSNAGTWFTLLSVIIIILIVISVVAIVVVVGRNKGAGSSTL